MKSVTRLIFLCGTLSTSAFGQTSDPVKNVLAIQQAVIAELRETLVPTGSIMPYSGDQAPRGWLLCDGSQLSTNGYSKLFGVIGYKFGGSGSSFALPNLRDEFLRGAGPTRAVGSRESVATAKGGLSTSTIRTEDLTVSASGTYQSGWPTGHWDSVTPYGTMGDGGSWGRRVMVGQSAPNEGTPYYFTVQTTGTATGGSWSTTINSTDSETRPRNVAVNYIIKL
ncbi:MAG TPA: tail fiber protein [Oligoflexus sp.]|uniref:tail fiber protein n=1 Tax=Oligoflexus sp. TaxID=1971216 RepID=UPI002D66E2B2|nr:tail fiber protein [Oligoflexus sp.]HYX39590.1 tail fiber protein [Oligoflexus sp.]